MLKILVVEDDISIADMLQEVLEAAGFFVTDIACTVDEATRSVNLHRPDVAVVDLCLANGDVGSEIRRRLAGGTHLPILFSTGSSDALGLTRSDGDAVIIKPYRLQDVSRGIEILSQLAKFGKTSLAFPRSFRLLDFTPAIS
jgi:DNA-binding response OmpR family regulator